MSQPREVELLSADGVPISAVLVSPGDAVATSTCFVVAHGFTGSWRRAEVQAICAGLAPSGAVVAFDFRGHGSSGGGSTVGDREVLDLDAAVRWARDLGHRRVVTVGWSMGACVVVRHAALHRGVDAVVAVSGPSRWHYRGTAPMRLLHRGVETRTGRMVLRRFFDTRIASAGDDPRDAGGGAWDPPPSPPDAVAGLIAPTPLLIVHGDADPYFPLDHALWLARAAREPVDLWVEPGFGHAETAATPDLVARIGGWAVRACASARMPA